MIDLLNLEEKKIKSIDYSNVDGHSHVYVSLEKEPRQCPHCNSITSRTNGTQTVRINHPVFNDRRCTVHLRKYRYICSLCKCTFMTSNELAEHRKSMAYSVRLRLLELAKDEHLTFSFIAKELNISVTSAISMFMSEAPIRKSKLSTVICIDEVYLGKSSRRKYAVILLDFHSNKIIDFIYGRSVEDCIRVLGYYSREERYAVKYISTDMYQGFIRLSKSMFPKAKVCVDSFHVITLILNEFDKLIKSIMNGFERNTIEYYLLKKQRFLILKNSNKIEWTDRSFNKKLGYYVSNAKLKEMIFDIDSRIKMVYTLKENYIDFNRQFRPSREILLRLIDQFDQTGIYGFKKVSRTLNKNFEYIMNSFTRVEGRRISNGPIESRNNTIKLIIRNAAGYRNFENLKSRVIYVLNNKKR